MIKKKVVVVGGGPAGHNAAASAARYGAQVVLVERDVIGGLAHLRDCVPSKSMIATGGALSFAHRLDGMGLAQVETEINVQHLKNRIQIIENRLERSVTELLKSLEVQIIRGTARLSSPNSVSVRTKEDEIEIEADVIVLATGSRPRIPEWAIIDSERILTTRDAYPPKEIPEQLVVVGSGVTGVEFVHMFSSLGSEVTLIVSRQQVLPNKDPEAAALLEQTFLDRGVQLLKGARAVGVKRIGNKVEVYC
ncbi:MAG: FAD-dependent oxidoreductase, partial [Actinobacteria bacterium]|nr:FAD-dependent oxidoreductase [Actinomycetota bacterium]